MLGSSHPFLLDFNATWCAPCRALDPILHSLAERYRGQLRFGKIDIDTSPGVASRLGVRGAPTLVLFRDGKEQSRRLGFTNRTGLVQLLAAVATP